MIFEGVKPRASGLFIWKQQSQMGGVAAEAAWRQRIGVGHVRHQCSENKIEEDEIARLGITTNDTRRQPETLKMAILGTWKVLQ